MGTVVWTAPTGRTYKTLPGSRIFFPAWDTTTAELPQSTVTPAQPASRGLMMPKRKRARAAECAQRIQHERKLNAAQRAAWARQAAQAQAQAAQRHKPPSPEPITDDDDADPPPF